MKKCVKIISILVAVTLLLSSCSADIGGIIDLLKGKSVFEIKGDIPGDGILDAEFFGDDAVILSYNHFEDGEDEYDTQYYLSKINAKRNKVEQSLEIEDCPLNDPYKLDRNDDGDVLIVGYESKEDIEMSVAYSVETLEQKSEKEAYKPFLPPIERENNALGFDFTQGETITSLEFSDIPNQLIKVFALRDEPDSVIFANDLDFSIFGSYENLAAGMVNDFSEESDETLVVYDFDNLTLINRMVNEKPEEENMTKFIISLFLNDRYLLYAEGSGNTETEEYQTRYYIWRYRVNEINEPFSSDKKTAEELSSSNDKICEQIKKSTGINVYVNSDEYDFYDEDEDYYLYKDANPLEVNILLTRIRAFLDFLPEGFAKEIYTDLKIFEYGGFDIFIGSSIKGTASAYASSFMDNLTIVFGTAASDFRTVAHEFMHIMDTRIEDYLGTDTSFYELWNEYNPDGFEYSGLDNDGYYEDETYEKYEDYFISAYSMATDAEDRAEIFSYLFIDSFSETLPPDWYAKKEPLREKTDFLVKMLREAYPSLENVKAAPWEKAASAYKKQVTFM